MKCPKCNSESIYVTDTLPADDNTIYRRKACSDCDHRFNTIEITEVDFADEFAEVAHRMTESINERFRRGYYDAYYKKHPRRKQKC